MKICIANCFENMKPSLLIILIDRDDGNEKKQRVEEVPRKSCV